jgi:shikimate dehydrogenase
MHNSSFDSLGLDLCYVPLEVSSENLSTAVEGLVALGFLGFNVTLPHKEDVAGMVDEMDEPARISGAVNTVIVWEDGSLRGLNTDGGGFVEACREAGVALEGERVLLVGAGGAAVAIGVALRDEGVREITIANRTEKRAEELSGKLRAPKVEVSVYPWDEIEKAAGEAGVIVNATYLGMGKSDPLPVSEKSLDAGKAVCDAVYRSGVQTALVSAALGAGCTVVSGERMLLYQGVAAQRAWTGIEPDVEAMSYALS